MTTRILIASLAGLIAGCTFSDLATYAVPECNPTPGDQTHDDCEHLNAGQPATCMPWQCDATTKRCARRLRDDDKDGDPARQCGGSDCDDHDPSLNGLGAGKPAVVAQLDPGSVAHNSVTLGGGARPIASFVDSVPGGACIQTLALDRRGVGPVGASCSLLDAHRGLGPVQVAARAGDGFAGAAFVSTVGCAPGLLGFTNTSANGQGVALDACAQGALLPAAEIVGTEAIVAHYAAPFYQSDGLGCTTPSVASLLIRRVSGAAQTGPVLGQPIALTPATLGLTPPALSLLPDGSGTLVAAPGGGNAQLWLLDGAFAVQAQLALAALAGSRGVALAAHQSGATLRAALVSQDPCAGGALVFARVDVDTAARALTPMASATVVGDGSTARDPTVAWSDTRQAWLVTWYSSAPAPRLLAQYLDDDARPLGAALMADAGSVVGIAGDDGAAWLFEERSGDAIVRAPLLCP